MAALSLYRPCRVSFSREEGRISRWTLALDSAALDERWASPLTFLFTRVSPERDYAYTCFLLRPFLAWIGHWFGGMEIVTTRNLGTIASSIFRSVSIIIYIIWLRLFISSKFLKKNKIVALALFSRWKVYIFRNKNTIAKCMTRGILLNTELVKSTGRKVVGIGCQH